MPLKPLPPTIDGLVGGFDVAEHWYHDSDEE